MSIHGLSVFCLAVATPGLAPAPAWRGPGRRWVQRSTGVVAVATR
jgi:hypothetical protein